MKQIKKEKVKPEITEMLFINGPWQKKKKWFCFQRFFNFSIAYSPLGMKYILVSQECAQQ